MPEKNISKWTHFKNSHRPT